MGSVRLEAALLAVHGPNLRLNPSRMILSVILLETDAAPVKDVQFGVLRM